MMAACLRLALLLHATHVICQRPLSVAVGALGSVTAQDMYVNWLGGSSEEEQDISSLEQDLDGALAHTLDGIAGNFEERRDDGEVDEIPKWRACINSESKQKHFCTGCCFFKPDGTKGDGKCVFKEGIDANPCMVPTDNGASDNLCYSHITMEEAKAACGGICFSGKCGPSGIHDFKPKGA